MRTQISRIHLDAIGGIAGDMFISALADTFPEIYTSMIEEIKGLPQSSKVLITLTPHSDGTLGGMQFNVREIAYDHSHHHTHKHTHAHPHQNETHHHTKYSDICKFLEQSNLKTAVIEHALNLFSILAIAEAQVHGIKPEDVTFHEVGAWDSIIDFVAAAYFINAIGPVQWTFSSLPIGGGTVKTAHGILPIPTPATALLMKNIPVVDDGIQGERVTPTGATIVKYLLSISNVADCSIMSISHSGNGFGSKKLPNISNVLRCLAFSSEHVSSEYEHICIITFEVDDQTSEDLAIGLDVLRQHPDVIEVYQAPIFGKKGRMLAQIQILVNPNSLESVCELCFVETSTLGIRISKLDRKILNRSEISLEDPKTRVKIAQRPNNQRTAKAEIADIAAISSSASQRAINKSTSEQLALKKDE